MGAAFSLAFIAAFALVLVGCGDLADDSTSIYIATAGDMAKIGVDADYPLSGTYTLTANITLTGWAPIGDETKPFTGKFDGNGKTVTLTSFNTTAVSEKAHLGVFGYVKGKSASSKALIKNLKIDSSVNAASTKTTGQGVGLAAGYAENAEIDSIILSGNLAFSSEKTPYVGGVAGYIVGSGTVIKNSNSSLAMDIRPGTGDQLIQSAAPLFLPYIYVGGIVGLFKDGAGIENCRNTGNVTADGTATADTQVFVGGIAGGSFYTMQSETYHGYIRDCSSAGDITGKAQSYWTLAGGIAGGIAGGNTSIERCFVTGNVSTAGTNSGYPYAGGIVGINYWGALVSQCYFTGTVSNNKVTDNTGGIAGYNSGGQVVIGVPSGVISRIENCWSGGTVQGYNNAGGIVGQQAAASQILNCYSITNVSATAAASSGVGGIAGYNLTDIDDAISACVALNPSIGASSGALIHRIAGREGTLANTSRYDNNYGRSDMTITPSGTLVTGTDMVDGANCIQKPALAFYIGLGWNAAIWKMGSDGYPKLSWQ